MRWNCPHCGTHLAIADEKLSASWSFSRCYKCAGFAIVRRADANLVKVDRAPTGEQVLLPEAHEVPTGNLSRNALNNFNRLTGEKPVIRPATPRTPRAPTVAAPVAARPLAMPASRPSNLSTPYEAPVFKRDLGLRLPDPLPEQPLHGKRKSMNAAIGLAGILALGSGIYLYAQGQALWEKSRTQGTESATINPASATVNAAIVPAPVVESKEIIRAPAITSAPVPAPAAIAAVPARAVELADQIHANAMAPIRNTNPKISVEVLVNNAHIHSGPGLDFPVIGTAGPHAQFAIEERKDRWLKIILVNPAAPKAALQKTAWIRNDLVRMIH